jgi:inhibitor of KinA
MNDRPPIIRDLGDAGLLVEFGERLDEPTYSRVRALDRALAEEPCRGFTEAIPAFASLFVGYDPLVTDGDEVREALLELIDRPPPPPPDPKLHTIPVHYGGAHSPDLDMVAEKTGLDPDQVIAAHLEATYRVYIYGFAPGYAYLGGTPERIRLPRRDTPVRSRPPGSIMIAGGQCIVTTVDMPTGWWVIGRTFRRVLDPDAPRPFLFDLGDYVRFTRAAG